jgi:hypothetical protein
MAEERKNIQRVEELEDRIILHIHHHNGLNMADEFPKKEILYSTIPNMPLEPSLQKLELDIDSWREIFPVKKLGRILAYHFSEWMETCSTSMQGLTGGPYIAKEDPHYNPQA